ncbi:TPA: hypothetical protein ACKFH8_004023, partial [Burkholderia multivorans]
SHDRRDSAPLRSPAPARGRRFVDSSAVSRRVPRGLSRHRDLMTITHNIVPIFRLPLGYWLPTILSPPSR